jgi:hypothetical protein
MYDCVTVYLKDAPEKHFVDVAENYVQNGTLLVITESDLRKTKIPLVDVDYLVEHRHEEDVPPLTTD